MGKGVGGYVRRCERVQGTIVHLRQRGDGWPYRGEVFWQCMPILSFVPFDVGPGIDTPIAEGLRSSHGQSGHHQDRP